MKKVTVLMSTFNGEKYVLEQIDSVLSQKDIEVSLIIRDDGSTDNTIELIKDFSNKYSNICLIEGEHNLGPAWSFIELIKMSPESEYYAFCDQDDVWKEEKLSSAISLLDGLEDHLPNMYYSNLMVTDEALHVIRLFHERQYKQESKYNAIVDNMAAGCTIVFNRKVKEYIKRLSNQRTEYILMHDAWIHLVCLFFGNVVYDKNAYIYYRQHGSNTVGTIENKNLIHIISEKTHRFFDKSIEPRRKLAESFYKIYADLLSENDKHKLLKIRYYKDGIKNRILLLLDRSISAPDVKRDLRYRLLIIRGLA